MDTLSLSLIVYLSKQNHCHVITRLLNLGSWFWQMAGYTQIRCDTAVTLLNLGLLLFAYSSLYYCIAHVNMGDGFGRRRLYLLLAISPAIQLLYYQHLYRLGYRVRSG